MGLYWMPGNNQKAEVVLMELNNRKRLAKVRANKNGQFLFRNIDASTPMFLLTRKPNTIEVKWGAVNVCSLAKTDIIMIVGDEQGLLDQPGVGIKWSSQCRYDPVVYALSGWGSRDWYVGWCISVVGSSCYRIWYFAREKALDTLQPL